MICIIKSKAFWSSEAQEDLISMHGPSDEFLDLLSKEINKEIDKEVLNDLRSAMDKKSIGKICKKYRLIDEDWEVSKIEE